MENISQTIFNELEKDLCENAKSTFIVSGGASPVQIFKDLSTMQTKWTDINISLVDDRVVDINHDDSNEKLVNDLLIKDKAKGANFISICNQYKELINLKRPFGVMLLGMGEDGHFASLFPALLNHSSAFDVNAAPDFIVTDQPLGSPSYNRISMNLSMLLNTKKCILLVPNEDKRKIVDQAYTNKKLPLHYLLTQKKTIVLFSDLKL